MVGRTPVTLGRLANHLNGGDKNADWVFAGAIVFKSGLKTSQKVGVRFQTLLSFMKNTPPNIFIPYREVNTVYGRLAI